MSLDKPLHEITEVDLQAVITEQVAEGKTIDYKKGIHLTSDVPRDEFRRDITAFANAIGGHLIIGMEEEKGFPTYLCGQDIADPDKFKLQLEEVLQNKITPRIPGIGIHSIQLRNGRYAVVVRTPRSFAKPHQIAVGSNDFQFWARNSGGKYRLSVDELRSVILQSASVAERIRQFRMERIGNVVAGDMPVIMVDKPMIVLHLVPLGAFDSDARYDLTRMNDYEYRTLTGTLIHDETLPTPDGKYNLDGYITSISSLKDHKEESYFQLFRNGIIEAVDAFFLNDHGDEPTPLWPLDGEKAIYKTIARGLQLQEKLGVPAPVTIMLSLIGVAQCRILRGKNYGRIVLSDYFGRDIMLLPESLIMSFSGDIDAAIKPIFDAVWNASGYPECLNYDQYGKHKFAD